MDAPLKGMLVVTNPFGAPGYGYFGRHAGVDLRAAVGTPLYAPDDGIINEKYVGSQGIKVLGMDIGEKWHRFLHLDSFKVNIGDKVKKGQLIGYTGNTGGVAAHLHWDVRKQNTKWTDSFSNYYNPIKLIEEDEMVTLTGLNVIYRFLLGKSATTYGKEKYLGKVSWDAAYEAVKASSPYQSHINLHKTDDKDALQHLPKELRS